MVSSSVSSGICTEFLWDRHFLSNYRASRSLHMDSVQLEKGYCIIGKASCVTEMASCIIRKASCITGKASCITAKGCIIGKVFCIIGKPYCIIVKASCVSEKASYIIRKASCISAFKMHTLSMWCDLCSSCCHSTEAKTYSCFCQLMKRMSSNFPHGGAMDTHFANMRSLIQVPTQLEHLRRSNVFK